MRYNALIFDLDGTLLDSLADIADAADHILGQHGYPTHNYEVYRHLVGNGLARLIQRAAPPHCPEDMVEVMLTELREYYARNWAVKTRPYAGIREALTALKDKDCKLFVLSNKDHAFTVDMVRHFFGDTLFTEVHGLKTGKPPKPDPTTTQEICRRHAIPPDETLFVGDLYVDLETADKASMKAVGVRWGFRPAEVQNADYVIDSPAELFSIVDRA